MADDSDDDDDDKASGAPSYVFSLLVLPFLPRRYPFLLLSKFVGFHTCSAYICVFQKLGLSHCVAIYTRPAADLIQSLRVLRA